MTWDYSDDHYPQIRFSDNHVAGIAKWLEKIVELAPQYKGAWNVMIADIWPNDNYSRLIGHVQMDDVSVGYDTGYRVCAYLSGGGIVGDSGDDSPLIMDWLNQAVKTPNTQKTLETLNRTHPFDIRLTICGDNPISAAPKIAI